jgi:CubicO group peptidase (beta-lactamase class C family)
MLSAFVRIAAALSLAICSAPALAQRIPAAVETYLDMQRGEGFSGAILVARGGQVVTRAFGQADREFAVANTPDTKFRIGSLTKQFTAAAILLLVEDGKLGLDDPLCRHLESCPEAWRPVTIRQLLNHSSGIPDFVGLPGVREQFALPRKLDDTLALLEAQPLDFAPGSDARYGNSGYLIAAHLIERLSGKSYAAFLDERIYRPLGMHDSGYAADAPVIPNRARGYVRRGDGFENAPFIDMSVPIGAGSQYSTVLDLYKWDRALRTDVLLPASLRAEMFAPGKRDFGLGWEIAEDDGRGVIEHNGDINGFGAFIARWPDEDAVVIILTNLQGTRVRDIKNDIAARLFAGG